MRVQPDGIVERGRVADTMATNICDVFELGLDAFIEFCPVDVKLLDVTYATCAKAVELKRNAKKSKK